MIKVVAFDLVGVLVHEQDYLLSNFEARLERMFGSNINDDEYNLIASKLVKGDINEYTQNIFRKIYEVDRNLVDTYRKEYPDAKIIIATNHVSYVREFIEKNFDVDDIIISAEIHYAKPDKEFYQYILRKYEIDSNELLFLDDNIDNINAMNEMCIKNIWYK
jgi:HAD superfamily hydrolase (TIGR01509 family)